MVECLHGFLYSGGTEGGCLTPKSLPQPLLGNEGSKKLPRPCQKQNWKLRCRTGARYYGSACFSRSIVHGIFVIPERMVNLMVIDSVALVLKS